MSKLAGKIKEEILKLIPPTLFFFIALHFVALVSALMRKETGIATATSLSVTVAALILGKAVLIADMMPFINRYPDKPLIYNVAWKTAVYVLVALVIHYLERLVEFWKKAGGFAAANENMLSEIIWPHFWAIQLILVVLILMYCTLHELTRVIGPDRMIELFFGSRAGTRA